MANPDRSVYDPPFDDDLMFDTVDEQETTRGRPLMILLGIVVLLAFAGVVWVAYRQGVEHAGRNEPPLLAQDPGPTRVAPPANQGATVPDNPIYDEIGPATSAAPATETLAPAPEEPAILPPSSAMSQPPPAPAAGESAPDMTTVAEIPAAPTTGRPVQPSAIPSEIAPSPAGTGTVDPLPPGASLPSPSEIVPAAPDFVPPAVSMPPVSAKPTPAELAAAKTERERLAKLEAAKKAEAARVAEEKRLQQLAAAKPVAPVAPPPTSVEEDFATPTLTPSTPAQARPDASGRPTLLTPPTNELPPPSPPGASPQATSPASPVPTVIATVPPAPEVAPPATRSEVVPDEAPGAPASGGGGQYVVQIGAFNSAEDAAASWKRMERSFSSALGGAAPEIRQTEVNGKTKYRLRATGYADRNAANSACNRLKAAGQGCFVAGR